MEDPNDQPRPVQLVLRSDRGDVPLLAIGERPRLLGRDFAVDVVIQRPAVSLHHLLIWRTDSEVMVRDVGSALGTRVGGRVLTPGDVLAVEEHEDIVLAEEARLFWRYGGTGAPGPLPEAVVPPRPDGANGHHSGSELSLAPPGRPIAGATGPVPRRAAAPRSVSLTVSCSDSGPHEVRLEDRDGHELRIRGENRVVLLYLLAEQRLHYEEGHTASAWLDDQLVGVGLWGSRGRGLPSSRINTVIARIRNQLREAGFPIGLLQKESGRTRLGGPTGTIVIGQLGAIASGEGR